MKDSTLINQKYKLIKKWKNKIYSFFDELEKNPNKEIDIVDIIFLRDRFKAIKLTKLEIKKLKELQKKGGE